MEAGLCYEKCKGGYSGLGPICWEKCEQGFADLGAFCFKGADIISSDNDGCPWYDKCGLTLEKGCSKCPEGYANDGCTCRRDPESKTKDTYSRGVGKSLGCSENEKYDAGLCYDKPKDGYYSVGPVAWQDCPPETEDIGVSCRKKNYSRGVGRPMKRIKS
jgi:hypothetical protein